MARIKVNECEIKETRSREIELEELIYQLIIIEVNSKEEN